MADSTRTWRAGCESSLPDDVVAVRWLDGTIECRHRLIHPAGSLVAHDGEEGVILTGPDVSCTTCSDACTT